MLMVGCWNLLDIRRVIEWMLMYQKEHGRRHRVSTTFSSLTRVTGKVVSLCITSVKIPSCEC